MNRIYTISEGRAASTDTELAVVNGNDENVENGLPSSSHSTPIPEATEQPPLIKENFHHLQTYLVAVNFSAVRDYLDWLPGEYSLRTLRTISYVQKLVWIVVVIFASVNPVIFLKDIMLQVNGNVKSKGVYTALGSLTSQLVLNWYFLFAFVYQTKKQRRLLSSFIYKQVIPGSQVTVSRLAITMFLISWAGSLVCTLVGVGSADLTKNSWQDLVEFHYREIKNGFTKWTDNAYTNETIIDYGSNVSEPFSKAVAAVGFGADFANLLVESVVQDLYLLLAYFLYKEVRECEAVIKNYEENTEEDRATALCGNIQNFFDQIRQASSQIESVFGSTLKFYHAHNLFLSVYFLYQVATSGDIGSIILGVFRVTKVILAYFFAHNAYKKSEMYRGFLSKEENLNRLGFDSRKLLSMKEAFEMDPISLGRGAYQVSETFIQKFVVTTCSFFFMLVDDTVDDKRFY